MFTKEQQADLKRQMAEAAVQKSNPVSNKPSGNDNGGSQQSREGTNTVRPNGGLSETAVSSGDNQQPAPDGAFDPGKQGTQDGQQDQDEGFIVLKDKASSAVDSISDMDQLNNFLSERFGGDVKAVVDEYESMKGEYDNLSEEANNYRQLSSTLQQMPTELSKALEAFAEGGDWRSVMKDMSTSIEFNAPAQDVPMGELLDHYYPGKIGKEDIQRHLTEERNPLIDTLVQEARNKYESERQSRVEGARKRVEQEKKQRLELERSLSEAKRLHNSKYERFGDVDEMERKLANPQSIIDIFYDNGKVRPEAFEALALVSNRDQFLKKITAKAANVAVSEERQRMLSNAPSSSDGGGTNSPGTDGSDVPSKFKGFMRNMNKSFVKFK